LCKKKHYRLFEVHCTTLACKKKVRLPKSVETFSEPKNGTADGHPLTSSEMVEVLGETEYEKSLGELGC